jgi:hypothetical protein
LLTYGLTDLSVPNELDDLGDKVSTKGFGRARGTPESLEASFTRGDGGAEMLSSFMPSFHAGGEGTWNNSWPLSSARFAILELVSFQIRYKRIVNI